MYSELIIRPKAMADQVIYPDVARRLVAEACDGISVPPLLFNRQPDGKTIQGRYWHKDRNHIEAALPHPPVVSFDGGKGFLRIFMLGQPGRDLMVESASTIGNAIAKRVGGPYAFSMNEGNCKVNVYNTPILYSIRRLVVSKDPVKSLRYRSVAPEEVQDDLRRIILRGLISQARWLDQHGASKLEFAVPDENGLGFEIAEGEYAPIEIKEGKYAAGYIKLVFAMNLDLGGPWFAGHLRSRGYGQIRKLILKNRGEQ